jgi:sugar phosphate isomerase/epimerase
MKLSVFTVSTPDLTPEELITAVQEAGIHGIEWRFADIPQDALDEEPSFWRNNRCSISLDSEKEEWYRYRIAAEKGNIESVGVVPYMSAGDLVSTEHLLQAASFMGASFIRLGVPLYDRSRHFSDLFKEMSDYLGQAEILCRNYGIKGLVETHHRTIISSASGAMRLCENFDPAYIGVLYDPGNMVHEGYENYKMGMELLGPYLAHVHVKNVGWQPDVVSEDGSAIWNAHWYGLRHGAVPWKQVISDLKEVGYDGYLGLEDFSGEFASREMLKQFSQYIRSLLKPAGGDCF